MWLLSSGVLFSFQDAPEGVLRTVLEGNPAYVFIDLARTALFEGSLPAERVQEGVLWALGTLVVGLVFFHRYEGRYSSAT
jgi:ABC-type polysaccharide/polyol phosphate export permease